MTPVARAEHLRDQAFRLAQESRRHKKLSEKHRRHAREKAQRADELVKKCRELGIEVTIEPHHTQAKGGHSDHTSQTPSHAQSQAA
jgi:hypothetical protein